MSPVLRLQRDALDDSVPVSSILKTAKFIAMKLKLTDAHAWMNLELNGFPAEGPSPGEHRWVHGVVRWHNPLRGLQPVLFADEEHGRRYSRRLICSGVVQLEAMLHSEPGDLLGCPLPEFNRQARGEVSLLIDRSEIAGILQRVRDRVLDWAIALENQGIQGDGIEFSQEEAERAPRVEKTQSGPVVNYYGPVGTAAVQQLPINSPQQVAVHLAKPEIVGLLDELSTGIEDAGLAVALREPSLLAISIVREELKAVEPKPSQIKNALGILKGTLEGAAAAHSLLPLVHRISSMLG